MTMAVRTEAINPEIVALIVSQTEHGSMFSLPQSASYANVNCAQVIEETNSGLNTKMGSCDPVSYS